MDTMEPSIDKAGGSLLYSSSQFSNIQLKRASMPPGDCGGRPLAGRYPGP